MSKGACWCSCWISSCSKFQLLRKLLSLSVVLHTHTPQQPSPALQVLPELWSVLNFTFCENPSSGKSLTLHVDFMQILKKCLSTIKWVTYLQLCIFTRINGKKQDLFHSGENMHLGIKLMESVNPYQAYMAVWLNITLMTYSNYALMPWIMFIPQHFLLSKRSLLFTQLQIQSEFWHLWWEINNLSRCCCHLCELFARSLICAELDWDVRW